MIILGISAFYHDSAAALVENGKVRYAAQEERFTRKKNDASFPVHAIRFCLSEAEYSLNDVDAIAYYEKPFLKFERLLETYYAFAPKGFLSFAKAMPVWLTEKLFMKQVIRKHLKNIGALKKLSVPIRFPEHHLSHAASAFYTSPFERSAFLTVDGVGEWATTSFGMADRTEGVRILGELHFPDSPGLFYSSFTYFLGFEVNAGEYKMMGLAPYSNASSKNVQHFVQCIKQHLIDLRPDGSFQLNKAYFAYPVGLRMVNDRQWEKLFACKRRQPDAPLLQVHADLAMAAQLVLEEILLNMLRHVKAQTKARYLCMAGGVALNCVANSVLHAQQVFDDIFIQPAAGDAGGALGAALAVAHIGQNTQPETNHTPFSPYLGVKSSHHNIVQLLRTHHCTYNYIENNDDLMQQTAHHLAANKVVGWFRGRAEFGPRALGNRSILASASHPEMQRTLNLKIKFREGFRPFAPAVCAEDYDTWFEPGKQSYYMQFTGKIKQAKRIPLPGGFEDWSLDEKRQFPKSALPAITHIDYSARIQVVTQEINPDFWNLLQAYKKVSQVGVLINTSFNVKDEPIVNTPEDALACFMKTEMDVLVLENCIIEK